MRDRNCREIFSKSPPRPKRSIAVYDSPSTEDIIGLGSIVVNLGEDQPQENESFIDRSVNEPIQTIVAIRALW